MLFRSQGIKVAGTEKKVGGYADDTQCFVSSEESLGHLLSEIRLYERASGSKLNRAKTEGLWLGRWRGRGDKPYGFTWFWVSGLATVQWGRRTLKSSMFPSGPSSGHGAPALCLSWARSGWQTCSSIPASGIVRQSGHLLPTAAVWVAIRRWNGRWQVGCLEAARRCLRRG